MSDGLSNVAIAERLGNSQRTVGYHATSILAKLDLTSRTSAVAFAIRHGLT